MCFTALTRFVPVLHIGNTQSVNFYQVHSTVRTIYRLDIFHLANVNYVSFIWYFFRIRNWRKHLETPSQNDIFNLKWKVQIFFVHFCDFCELKTNKIDNSRKTMGWFKHFHFNQFFFFKFYSKIGWHKTKFLCNVSG